MAGGEVNSNTPVQQVLGVDEWLALFKEKGPLHGLSDEGAVRDPSYWEARRAQADQARAEIVQNLRDSYKKQ
jgi:hypothetical protein